MFRRLSVAGVSLAALALCTSTVVRAEDGAGGLTIEQAVIAFGSQERILDASLSPDGNRVAFITPGPGQATVLQVSDIQSGAAKAVSYADGDPLTLTSCGWVSNARLLCAQYGISNMEGQTLAYSRLAAMNADGSDVVALGARERVQRYAQQSDGYVVDWLDGSGSKVLLARNYVPAKASANSIGSIYDGLGVDLIDTETAKVEHIEFPDRIARSYLSDGRGKIRIMATDESMVRNWQSRGVYSFQYRLAGDRDWLPFSTYSAVTDEGMYPIAVDGTANVAYGLKKTDGRDALYRVALDGSLKAELVYAHPEVDVSSVIRVGRQGRVIGASFATERRETIYFDANYKKLGEALSKALPQLPLIRFVDSSADETKHLIYASSDVDPGRYYLYDSGARSLAEVALVRPELENVEMGSVKPVTYRAADGTVVPAYLTLPPGSDGKDLPTIVMPHGGPAARDEWGFDWLAQFYVNRGYAVLQPNFRGSAGYGEDWFEENGFKSWEVAIGDINDGARWLVAEGIADPSKLAIVGWSYGGYAALQSNVVAPDLFKAIVAIAPVTDLAMLRSEQRGFINMRIAQDYIGEGPHIEAGSPAKHAERIKAPVLMFHGEKDINVDIAEARVMDRELTEAGKSSDLVEYPKLDHQLRDSAARVDMLRRSDAFLRSTLGM